jgi:hypothetical protein
LTYKPDGIKRQGETELMDMAEGASATVEENVRISIAKLVRSQAAGVPHEITIRMEGPEATIDLMDRPSVFDAAGNALRLDYHGGSASHEEGRMVDDGEYEMVGALPARVRFRYEIETDENSYELPFEVEAVDLSVGPRPE